MAVNVVLEKRNGQMSTYTGVDAIKLIDEQGAENLFSLGSGGVDPANISYATISAAGGNYACSSSNPSSLARLSELDAHGWTEIPKNAVIVNIRHTYMINDYLQKSTATPAIKTWGMNLATGSTSVVTVTRENYTDTKDKVTVALSGANIPSWYTQDLSKGYTSGTVHVVLWSTIYYYIP